jgi:hypothetical protein
LKRMAAACRPAHIWSGCDVSVYAAYTWRR